MAGSAAPMTQSLVTAPRPGSAVVRSIALHALAAVLMFISPLSLFVPAAFIHSSLRNGYKGGWLAVAAAAVFLGGFLFAGADSALTAAQVAPVARMIFEVGVPALVGAALIRRVVPFGAVLMTTVVTSLAGFLASELALRAIVGQSLYGAITRNFREVSASLLQFYTRAGYPADVVKAMGTVSDALAGSFMPFMLAGVATLMFLLSLVMLPRLPGGRATGGRFLFRNLVLPEGLLFVFIVAGLSPLASGSLQVAGFNALAIVAFLYLIQGMAIIRFWIVQMGGGLVVVAVAFLTLLVMTISGVAPFAFFLLGLFDPFADFRKLNRKDVPDESNSHR